MKKKRNIFSPVKEQFGLLVEYINILENKENPDLINEIVLLIELINNIKRQCELYLNYELMSEGKKINDRSNSL